jgi:hypothetical protein
MTPAESRIRKPSDRVSWRAAIGDQGTVTAVDWSKVEIDWDSGKVSYHHHNNMSDIETVSN